MDLTQPFNKLSVIVKDIEECTTDTDNCHTEANCTNTKGSFYCTCHHGYSGDGVTCDGVYNSIIQIMIYIVI